MIKNWKTFVSALIAALPFILKAFGIDLGDNLSDAITGTGLLSFGGTAKDNNVTGGTRQQ